MGTGLILSQVQQQQEADISVYERYKGIPISTEGNTELKRYVKTLSVREKLPFYIPKKTPGDKGRCFLEALKCQFKNNRHLRKKFENWKKDLTCNYQTMANKIVNNLERIENDPTDENYYAINKLKEVENRFD